MTCPTVEARSLARSIGLVLALEGLLGEKDGDALGYKQWKRSNG